MSKRLFPVFTVASLVFVFIWSACTKSTPFGADLLDDQVADFSVVDTFTVRFSLEAEDSLLTSDRSSTASVFLCGTLQDPKFGQTSSDIYSLIQLAGFSPDFSDAVLDSVVLYLNYNPDGFYGDTMQPQTLRVHQLTDTLQWENEYYSNQSHAYGDEIGVKENFLPRPNYKYNQFDTASTANTAAYINVPLSDSFGQMLLDMDSLSMTQDSLFWDKIRGLRISSSAGMEPGAMMSFNLNNSTFSFIRLYYAKDTVHYAFDYTFLGCNKFLHFQHDYAGTEVEPLIGMPLTEKLYLQSMGGLRLKMEMPYVSNLDSILVNKAELELTTLIEADDNPLLSSADQILFTESRGDTSFAFTNDVLFSLGATLTGGFFNFGGFPENTLDKNTGETVQRYRMTLTQEFQAMVDDESGDVKNKTLYINVYPQRISPMRVILHGPQSMEYPAKLTLKYTRL
ncbi:MAG: DUF4270 family protein [Saprospiraceae bacterium]